MCYAAHQSLIHRPPTEIMCYAARGFILSPLSLSLLPVRLRMVTQSGRIAGVKAYMFIGGVD